MLQSGAEASYTTDKRKRKWIREKDKGFVKQIVD